MTGIQKFFLVMLVSTGISELSAACKKRVVTRFDAPQADYTAYYGPAVVDNGYAVGFNGGPYSAFGWGF